MKRLILVLIVLAALFVAADRAAVAFAEREAAQRIQQYEDLGGRPQVDIRGFPFLTQALAMRFDHIDVTFDEVGAGTLRAAEARIALFGVSPMNGGGAASIERLRGAVLVGYDELEATLGREGLSLGPGPDGRLRIEGSADVLGRSVDVAADSRVDIDGGDTLVVRAERVEAEGAGVSAPVEALVRDRLDFQVSIPTLPDGFQVRDVRVTPRGVEVIVRGRTLAFPP
ncbi:MAG: LmeA family phospholipid-binding protein [Carbonactinosporaceae bacterium]